MFTKFLSTPIILLCFFLFHARPGNAQDIIKFDVQRATSQVDEILKEQFTSYTLATMDAKAVSRLLRSRSSFEDIKLQIGGNTYGFNLEARDLRADNYKLRVLTDHGPIEVKRSPNMTYAGNTQKGFYDVRITSDEDFFSAMILQENDEIYIEPAADLVPGAPVNQFVIYRASKNLKKMNLSNCGVHDIPVQSFDPENNTDPQQSFSSRACKVVQIALADDHLMFNKYGGVAGVEDHNMTVINNVLTNYDTEFNDDLQFNVVEIYVATTAGNDPWPTTTNINTVLDAFTNWGPSGFSNTHDVGSLWSSRNYDGDVIGLAWLSAVCTSFKYNCLEDFTTNANFLRVLQAHEMGHNFGADHDAANSPTIMAPAVNNTNTWSNASISAINNYIGQVNCLSPCSPPAPPVANFDATPTSGCTPLVVSFDDLSTNNPTSWLWTFSGGTPGTSTQQNPNVTYNSPGSFTVTLQATNGQGTNTKTVTNYIVVSEPPFADFDYTIDQSSVDFQNLSSSSTTYFWTFGDGATSSLPNPLHVYAQDGIYTVTLTASNSCGSDVFSQTIEIITLPVAAFSSNVTQGCDPFEVEFINLSSFNAESFSWSFPGGSPPSSSAFEPTIVYETPGTFSVTLTAINQAGDDIQTINGYITVIAQPAAEFSYTAIGLQATFNSLGSMGDTYFWNFGDGNTSALHNPVHVYSAGGTYLVSLTVSNACGSENLQLNVTVTGTPIAAFSSSTQFGCAPLVVQFTNQSGGNPTSYNWIFQGGTPSTSNQANPLVTYNTPGLFDVQLTVTNGAGVNVLSLDNYIEVPFPATSGFGFSVSGLQATFTNQSSNSTGTFWDFGDINTSTEYNPTHIYNQDGVYTVTLISEGACGNDTSTAQVTIQTPPQAGFSFQQMSACVPANVVFSNQSSSNATSFAWSFPGGNPSTSNLPNPTVSYTNPGVYDVMLIAYSAGGTDTMVMSDFVTIGIEPSAAFLLSTSGLTVNFENQTTGADTYLWLFGDSQTSTETNPSHDYNAFGTYSVSLIASNACGSDTMEIVIVLSTVPNSFFTYSTHSGCAPFEVQFTDQSQNNPTSWNWTFEGGEPPTSTNQNPTVIYNVPGAHSVTLQVSNSQGTDVLVLDGLIEVGGTPDATFNHTQNENIVSLEYPGTDYDSLRWDFGDGRTDNSLNPSVEYNTSGQYLISLIVYNACGTDTTSLLVTITITSTEDPTFNQAGWTILPNPYKDVLTVLGNPLASGNLKLSLFDMTGRMISTEDWVYPMGTASKKINGDRFPSGLILVVLQDSKSRVVLKAIHQ